MSESAPVSRETRESLVRMIDHLRQTVAERGIIARVFLRLDAHGEKRASADLDAPSDDGREAWATEIIRGLAQITEADRVTIGYCAEVVQRTPEGKAVKRHVIIAITDALTENSAIQAESVQFAEGMAPRFFPIRDPDFFARVRQFVSVLSGQVGGVAPGALKAAQELIDSHAPLFNTRFRPLEPGVAAPLH